jgi:glutamate racemase
VAAPQAAPDARERPIAVFDSGVGGLTVLHDCLVQLPHRGLRLPRRHRAVPVRGPRPGELEAFALEIGEALLRRRAKLLVVACNSATAAALPALQRRMMQTTLGVDVIGVVRPGAVHAVAATRTGRVGVLATPVTVATGAYADALAAVDPHVHVTQVPCPDLAGLIEQGFPFDDELVETVRGYVRPLREAEVDTVVLGCTHYPLVRPMLQRMLGPGVTIISSGAPLARQVEHVLGARGLAHPRADAPRAADPVEGDYAFLCTGDVDVFRALGTRFLQMPLGAVDRVAVGRTPEVTPV